MKVLPYIQALIAMQVHPQNVFESSHSLKTDKGIERDVLVWLIKSEYSSHDNLHLFRFVQESIANTVKHSKVTDILVDVTNRNDTYTFVIKDIGCGFDVKGLRETSPTGQLGL